MSVVAVREELFKLAEAEGRNDLRDLALRLFRRKSDRPRAAPDRKHPKLTKEKVAEIRAFADNNPDMLQRDIAKHFGVDQGRVNEVIMGDRK